MFSSTITELMSRSSIVLAVGLTGIVFAVAVPVRSYEHARSAERAAEETLLAIGNAQIAFRVHNGAGGYAADLASLATACPGSTEPSAFSNVHPSDYSFLIRPALRSKPVGRDCHGRETVSDYYAAAEPKPGSTPRQALALTSRGRVYVFFDGVAPTESDMELGGLAVPFDQLDTFRVW